MNLYKERIEEYEEEIQLIDQGLEVYAKFGNNKKVKSVEHFKVAKEEFDLRLEKKRKIAALAQLREKMIEVERVFKIEVKQMKENFKAILTKAGNLNLQGDKKRMVMGIKDKEFGKSWISDEHKLQAYKLLLNIVNENSNGKAI